MTNHRPFGGKQKQKYAIMETYIQAYTVKKRMENK